MEDLKIKQAPVSVVVLTKNGGALLRRCIERIFSQKVSFAYEMVVVDSGSTDGTLNFLKNYPVRLFRIKPESFCFGLTRDYGFQQTKGQYIVTLSQDTVPANEYWLQKLVEPLQRDEADVVQGRAIRCGDRKVFYWEEIGLFYFTSEGRQFTMDYGGIGLSCCCLAMKRDAWNATRFGHVKMSEDKVIQKKLFEKGLRMMWAPDSFVCHGHNYTLRSLMKRCENEGFGWKYVGVKYGLFQMLRDLCQPKCVYGHFVKGLLQGKINNLSTLLFLLVRPICLFRGNTFNKTVKL